MAHLLESSPIEGDGGWGEGVKVERCDSQKLTDLAEKLLVHKSSFTHSIALDQDNGLGLYCR